MVETIFNYIKKPWEKMCLILLQIHINSYWRFAKRLAKNTWNIFVEPNFNFIADLVKIFGHCCCISNSISIGNSVKLLTQTHEKIAG
jgi:hypothetical protein